MQRPIAYEVATLERRELSLVHGIVVHAAAVVDGRLLEFNERWSRRSRSAERSLSSWDASVWMAVCFAIGSVVFIVAGISAIVGPGAEATTVRLGNLIGATVFSVGALFAVEEARCAVEPRRWSQFWASIAGRASLIQGVAALLPFQVGMVIAMANTEQAHLVAALNTVGSLGFVLASYLYLRESWPAHDVGTTSSAANLLGSVLFLVGSTAGFAPPGAAADAVVNWSFLVGSMLFAVGAITALVELSAPARSTEVVGG
ncbi:YrhK family protein [Ruania halotolerans]|uniref:YrhK family protein n=1 Tax=Ruania halotolerans TaxID=2897773 RepID=UPI001E431207|nr:YrhK family protein [Ruania halotolerans]UFU05949.1 YrhK family protein [Ruania halotolerans]